MTAALIIAAGKTDRKEKFSPEKHYGRITAIERVALLFQLAGISRVVVVGAEEAPPQKLAPAMNLIFLTLPTGGEMFDGIRLGLTYLKEKVTQVLVAPVDVPMFSAETVHQLLAAEGDVCLPSFDGKSGHPILLRSPVFPSILAYHGENGLKGAIDAAGVERHWVQTQDEGILPTPQAQEDLLRCHEVGQMRPVMQLHIRREKAFYGPSIHQLLQLTRELGSLSGACQYMGISYSKGRKIISTMEDQLGVPVLQRQQGGRSGGSSHLTPQAEDMMERYRAFAQEASSAVAELFQKYFDTV